MSDLSIQQSSPHVPVKSDVATSAYVGPRQVTFDHRCLPPTSQKSIRGGNMNIESLETTSSVDFTVIH